MAKIIIDPYENNILISKLNPPIPREKVVSSLTFVPDIPRNVSDIPKHIRMHFLLQLMDLHLPTVGGARLMETIDLIVRPSYRYRNPALPATWASIAGEKIPHMTPRAPASVALCEGFSGTGKTQAILRALSRFSNQVIEHTTFPGMAGKHAQLVWMSVDVPASGRAPDLAVNLMREYDAVMQRHFPRIPERFALTLARSRRDGMALLSEWIQVAQSQFLGILHLDEVQNFFRLQSLEARRKRKSGKDAPELSIIEDQCLKWLLTVSNTWQIGLLISGTPDGVAALTRRMANAQRFSSIGYHPFTPILSVDDPYYGQFITVLMKFQYVKKPIVDSQALGALILELTGGIRRLIIALWIAAHRVAFERKEDDLRLEDFRRAAATFLAPVGPAVAALRSGDQNRMSCYEDLIPRDSVFWARFWGETAQQ